MLVNARFHSRLQKSDGALGMGEPLSKLDLEQSHVAHELNGAKGAAP